MAIDQLDVVALRDKPDDYIRPNSPLAAVREPQNPDLKTFLNWHAKVSSAMVDRQTMMTRLAETQYDAQSTILCLSATGEANHIHPQNVNGCVVQKPVRQVRSSDARAMAADAPQGDLSDSVLNVMNGYCIDSNDGQIRTMDDRQLAALSWMYSM